MGLLVGDVGDKIAWWYILPCETEKVFSCWINVKMIQTWVPLEEQ